MSTKRMDQVRDVLGTRRAAYVSAAVVAVLLAGGMGIAVAAGGADERRTPSTEVGAQVRDTGKPLAYASVRATPRVGKVDVATATDQVVAGMSAAVSGVTASRSAHGLGLHVHLVESNDDIPDVWAAGVAVGAIGELVRTDQTALSQVVATAEASGPGRDGPATWTGVGLGAVALGEVFSSPSDDVLASRVQRVADQFGLAVPDVRLFHPLATALDVTFRETSGGKRGWTLDDLRRALVGSKPELEGVLIRVDSASGEPLAKSGIAYRTGEHGLWCSPHAEGLCGDEDTFGTPLPESTPSGSD